MCRGLRAAWQLQLRGGALRVSPHRCQPEVEASIHYVSSVACRDLNRLRACCMMKVRMGLWRRGLLSSEVAGVPAEHRGLGAHAHREDAQGLRVLPPAVDAERGACGQLQLPLIISCLACSNMTVLACSVLLITVPLYVQPVQPDRLHIHKSNLNHKSNHTCCYMAGDWAAGVG